MKKMRKISLVLVLAMLVSIMALSGCGGKEPSPYDGTWKAISAEMFGMVVPIEEIYPDGGFEIEVKGMGSAHVSVDGSEGDADWEMRDGMFVLDVEGEDMAGTVDDYVMIFEDVLGSGATLYFAKEGSPADDPSYFEGAADSGDESASGDMLLPPERSSSGAESNENLIDIDENIAIGHWECDFLAFSEEDEGTDDPGALGFDKLSDILTMDIKPDNTVRVYLLGVDLGDCPWYIENGILCIDIADDIFFDIYCFDESSIEVDLYLDNTYTEIYCSKF